MCCRGSASSPPEALTMWRSAYATDDRHRSDVHLLRHAGDTDGDRLRVPLRSLLAPRRLQLRARDGRAPDAHPDAGAVPAPAHARSSGTGPSALGGRPRVRPLQPSQPCRAPGSGWRCRIPGQGGPGHESPAHAGPAALGDARRRGDGRRHGRADRQGAPLGGRRRGRGRDAGQAARPDARGQRRHGTVPALDARSASVAGRAGDRRAARHSSGAPSGGCVPRAKSAARRFAWPVARWTTASAPSRSPWGRPTRSRRRWAPTGRCRSPSWVWRTCVR